MNSIWDQSEAGSVDGSFQLSDKWKLNKEMSDCPQNSLNPCMVTTRLRHVTMVIQILLDMAKGGTEVSRAQG